MTLAEIGFLAVMAASMAIAHARQGALFEPGQDRQLLVIGQDLGAVGGMPAPNNNGYVDHVPIRPGGVTTYTSLPFLLGLSTGINLGSGDLCAQAILGNPAFDSSVLVIGLHLADQEKSAAAGGMDPQIKHLAEWIKAAHRPVLLRIGYEFDGKWNHYDPENYKKAFRRIVTMFRELHVTNCATVWQSCTSPVNDRKGRNLEGWYPGDEYVDWMGYSWFLSGSKQTALTDELVSFARSHSKPIMVCESAPQGYDLARLTRASISGNGKERTPKTPQEIWNEWYEPFFSYIAKNRDVIKIVAYINVNWDSQPMWGPPHRQGYWGDSRVEANDFIKEKWMGEIAGESWLKASPSLFHGLQAGGAEVPK